MKVVRIMSEKTGAIIKTISAIVTAGVAVILMILGFGEWRNQVRVNTGNIAVNTQMIRAVDDRLSATCERVRAVEESTSTLKRGQESMDNKLNLILMQLARINSNGGKP